MQSNALEGHEPVPPKSKETMSWADLALDDRGGGRATIYARGMSFKRVPNQHGTAGWFRCGEPATLVTMDQTTLVDVKTGALFESTYQHQETAKKALRFPRLRFPRTKLSRTKQISALIEKILASLQQREEARVEIGRACLQLKDYLVPHGEWLSFFDTTFAPKLNLRTAERYMKLARKKDAILQIDSVTNFTPAKTEHAKEMEKATATAKAKVVAVQQSESKRRARHLYRLPLLMPDAEHAAMDTLRKLPAWPSVERHIRSFLRRICRKYVANAEKTGARPAA